MPYREDPSGKKEAPRRGWGGLHHWACSSTPHVVWGSTPGARPVPRMSTEVVLLRGLDGGQGRRGGRAEPRGQCRCQHPGWQGHTLTTSTAVSASFPPLSARLVLGPGSFSALGAACRAREQASVELLGCSQPLTEFPTVRAQVLSLEAREARWDPFSQPRPKGRRQRRLPGLAGLLDLSYW